MPGIIRALCSDSYHHDSPEFAEHGFHSLGTLKLVYRPRLPGDAPGYDFTIVPRSNLVKVFMKDFRRADGLWVCRFECPCGRDPQRLETHLVERVLRYASDNPRATRFDLDITTI